MTTSFPPRRSQQGLFYSGAFAVQDDFDTALDPEDIDTALARDESGNIAVFINKRALNIMDCTSEYLANVIFTARSSRIVAPFYVDVATLVGFLKWAAGVTSGDVSRLLPPYEYDLPVTSLIYSNRNSGIDPLLFKSMVVDFIEITGRAGNRLTGNIQWKGSGNITTVEDYVEPDCQTISPLFIKDGAFSLDSVSRVQDLRAFTCRLGNNAATEEEDSYPFNSADIFRNQRGEQRDYTLNITLAGAEGDATWNKANSITPGVNHVPFSIRIGPTTGGVTIASVGNSVMEQTGDPGFDSATGRKTLPLRLTALRPSGQSSPITITHNHS